jgi:hypothetical protein
MPIPTTPEYQEAIQRALAFKIAFPDESQAVSGRIFGVNESTLRSRRQREKKGNGPGSGGHNRVLTEAILTTIIKYSEDMVVRGRLGATEKMVFGVICYLKEIEGQRPPTYRWFQNFLRTNPTLFFIHKTKPIARNRVSAQDVEDVQTWFNNYTSFCTEQNIGRENIINFDEGGFQIGVTSGEEILVPGYMKNVYSLFLL